MKLLRRILRGILASTALAVIVVIGTWMFTPAVTEVRACWNTVLQECFNEHPIIRCQGGWPWRSPNTPPTRLWRRSPDYPPYPTWGMQRFVYDVHNCAFDSVQGSLWCFGCPPDNDPRYDTLYPANYDVYVTYGPISLVGAVAAGMTFWLYNRSEAAQDSIYWGAARTFTLARLDCMNIGGSHSGLMNGFEPRVMRFDSLRNAQRGDSVSFLGEPTVYVFWRFRSNQNAIRNVGAFIDNVTIRWDDGGVNLTAAGISLRALDSSLVIQPVRNDTIFATFIFNTCAGGIGIYQPFRVIGLLDDRVILDTLMENVDAGVSYGLRSAPWVVDSAGTHTVRFVLDTLNSVAEVNENDNVQVLQYYLEPPNPPPTFIWITPGDTILIANEVAILRWEAYDPEETASLQFFRDLDAQGCTGSSLPTGVRQELDGPDSLIWDTRAVPNGLYWPFVRIRDSANDLCLYAPYPVQVDHSAAPEHELAPIPDRMFLAQNIPNPFNLRTELRYGIAKAGHVTLTLYDLLGRETAVLVNAQQTPGNYRVEFDGSGLASGLYFYVLTAPEGTLSRKMLLMK